MDCPRTTTKKVFLYKTAHAPLSLLIITLLVKYILLDTTEEFLYLQQNNFLVCVI